MAAPAGGRAATEDSGQPLRASSARRTAGTASSSLLHGPRPPAPRPPGQPPPRGRAGGGGGGGKEGGGGRGGSPSCWHSATIAGSSKMPHGTMQCPPRPIPARPGARCAPPPSQTFCCCCTGGRGYQGRVRRRRGGLGSARRCCLGSPARAPARRTAKATGLRHHRGQGRGESAAAQAGYHRGRFAVGGAGRGRRRARGGHRPAGGGGGGGGAIMRKEGGKEERLLSRRQPHDGPCRKAGSRSSPAAVPPAVPAGRRRCWGARSVQQAGGGEEGGNLRLYSNPPHGGRGSEIRLNLFTLASGFSVHAKDPGGLLQAALHRREAGGDGEVLRGVRGLSGEILCDESQSPFLSFFCGRVDSP